MSPDPVAAAAPEPAQRGTALALALAATVIAIVAVQWEWPVRTLGPALRQVLPLRHATLHSLVLLALGLALTLPAPRRQGLRIGSIRAHWKGVLLVCGLPVLLAALVYPQLHERPFAGASAEMWLLSPLAQDLVFMGFVYGRLEVAFPAYVLPRLRVRRALLAGAVCFATWHLPNLLSSMSTGWLVFQLGYTAAGFVLTGLSRQWTGSIAYVTLSHMAVNFVAWYAH